MVGTAGKYDIFEINAPTNQGAYADDSTIAEKQDIWIYGMVNQDASVMDLDQIIIKMNSGTSLSDPMSSGMPGSIDVTILGISSGNHENGTDYSKLSMSFGNDTEATTDDYLLDLYLSDMGNIDSDVILDRIKWEY